MKIVKKIKFNYLHIICILITFGFMAVGVFRFPNALGRIIESFRDLGLSVAYYFCELFKIPHSITPTVNNLAKIPFFKFNIGQSPALPSTSLPEKFDGVKSNWSAYWQLWVSKDNFKGYLLLIGKICYYFLSAVLIAIPFYFALRWLFKRYLKKQNNDYDKDSRPLKAFKWVAVHTYCPVKKWILNFILFVREHKTYWSAWVCLWLFYFNVFTIIIEFIAFYLYFVISFDIAHIYRQVYKLGLDLWAVLSFVPVWVWVLIGIYALNAIAKSIAYRTLDHHERRNRGFLNERGIVNFLFAYIGGGKTSCMTDMSLSYEAQFLFDAYEIIIETDMHFPNFPWINLENWLKKVIGLHVIYDIWSCRRLVRSQYKKWYKDPCRKKIFNYDYELYGLTYDNKLYVSDIWEAIEDYACAYFIYTIQSSYLISNYSIRSDKLISDLGNFPVWDTDFFRRDSRLIDSFSRHSHILDFDMLRLGKKMLEDNPNRNAFGFGIYVVSEIDKERKNGPELDEVKRKSNDCNQKNDLFNACIKMSRHACVIANRVFVRVLGDLQRMGSLNSDMAQLGDRLEIHSKGASSTVLPFFAPFWLIYLINSFFKSGFIGIYQRYRFSRGDNTLLMYLIKNVIAKFDNYCERTENLFGCQVLRMRIERGFEDCEKKDSKYFMQSKKWRAKRYSTDCLSGIFENRAELNYVGIDDLAEYADIMAMNAELLMQNSHFQTEINLIINKEIQDN